MMRCGKRKPMHLPILVALSAIVAVILPNVVHGDTINGRVIQVTLPAEDVTSFYVERSVFTVALRTATASVEAQKLYIGDGKIAVQLVAHPTKGIFLQDVKYSQGDQFKKGSTIKVRPGYKKASNLKPGDVYVTLPGVTFKLPGK